MLSLRVDGAVGDNALDVLLGMLKLARHMDMMITSDFNGIHFYVVPNDEFRVLEQRYYCACELKMTILPHHDTRWD
jgi:hypothetical protein